MVKVSGSAPGASPTGDMPSIGMIVLISVNAIWAVVRLMPWLRRLARSSIAVTLPRCTPVKSQYMKRISRRLRCGRD